jgi:hypothetical protein
LIQTKKYDMRKSTVSKSFGKSTRYLSIYRLSYFQFLQAKWVGGVHSVRSTPKEVYNSGNCLALLPESFLLFTEISVEESGRRVKKWKCHFEVIRVTNSPENEIDAKLKSTEVSGFSSAPGTTRPNDNINMNPNATDVTWNDPNLLLEIQDGDDRDGAGASGTDLHIIPSDEPPPHRRSDNRDWTGTREK